MDGNIGLATQREGEMGFGGTDGSVGSATPPVAGHHRLRLPPPAVQLASAQGKEFFRDALLSGGAECYFRLAEAFHTQSEPAFCGLGTLVMVLNALEVDPGAQWKGSWRWYDESLFACCVDLEDIKKQGITWRPWVELAREQGLHVRPSLAAHTTIDAFREAVRAVTRSADRALVVNYSRSVVGQMGTGHYSPIGAYVAEHDVVLLFDVARFKHPPHWLPLGTLWEAMAAKDPVSGFARGYAVLSRDHAHSCGKPNGMCSIRLTNGRGRLLAAHIYFGGNAAGDGRTGTAHGASGCMPVLLRALLRAALGNRSSAKLAKGSRGGMQDRKRGARRGLRSSSAAAEAPLSAAEAVRGAQSPPEELWLAMRSLPSAAAALVSLCDVDSGMAPDAGVRLAQAREQLAHTRVHQALTEAEASFRKRDGPLPASISACAALLLVLHALVPEETLHQVLPRTAPWIIDSEPLLRDGAESVLAEDVLCAREALLEMASSELAGMCLLQRAPSAPQPQKIRATPAPQIV